MRRIALGHDLAASIAHVDDAEKLRAALPGIALTPTSVTLPADRTCTGSTEPGVQILFDPVPAPGEPYTAAVQAALKEQAAICDATSAPDPGSTPSEGLAKKWESFTDKHLAPLTDPLLGALSFLTTGVVLAFLLVTPVGRLSTWLFVTRHGRRDEGRRFPISLTGAWRLFWIWFGAILLVATSIIVLFLPGQLHLLVYLLLVLLGAVPVAWGLSHSPRLRIKAAKADGTEDHDVSAHVAALVQQLGQPDFRRLDTAAPADATALQDAGLTTTPEGKVAAAAYKLLERLVPRTPWLVRVQTESADQCHVMVQHHGVTVTSAVVDRDRLGLRVFLEGEGEQPVKGPDDKPVMPDLHGLCAAVAVEAMATIYDMPGLDGASTWEGIGLHFLARTDLQHHDERVPLLARALDADPDNRPVLLELWHARFRKSQKPSELDLYSTFLESFQRLQVPGTTRDDERDLSPDLRARAAFARYVALINRHYAQTAAWRDTSTVPAPGAVDSSVQRVASAITALTEILETRVADKEVSHRIYTEMNARLEAGRRWVHMMSDPWDADLTADMKLAPSWVAYSWACFHASWAERLQDLSAQGRDATELVVRHRRRAVQHLHAAHAVTELRDWTTKDPQLATLVRSREYLDELGRRPRSGFLDVQILAAHKDRLVRIGGSTPATVLQHTVEELAALLLTSPAQATVVRKTAALAQAVPSDLAGWRFEICDLLTAADVLDIGPGQHPELVETLSGAMNATLAKSPTTEMLAAWLRPSVDQPVPVGPDLPAV
ncbi:hypothetical protein ACI3ET_01185 [Ornithinimicrobium sp. LYQ121]|uniref:hypothetical protein n=1 Tax=Ornithinimicrobium sp. LYQ121 TaxID=3378801 RepID=UPI00385351E1